MIKTVLNLKKNKPKKQLEGNVSTKVKLAKQDT